MKEKIALLRKINKKREAMYQAVEAGEAYDKVYKLSCELDLLIVDYMKKYQHYKQQGCSNGALTCC
ncbi:aspartyl-phosphate phosphatase Spo0E family protein [Heliorestis convoluta]|nr:aspartyl-phosphate phosphatase Spo0E family protein [Heliorestis convoluta]